MLGKWCEVGQAEKGTAAPPVMSLHGLMFLILCEERGTLLVSRGSAPVDLAASRGRNSDNDSSDEKQSHDDKGKDPLESNHLVKELRNSNCSSKDAQ